MTKAAYLISTLILIAAGSACVQVPAQPDGEEIIITPVAYQTQTPPDIIVATPTASPEVPTATASLSPTTVPTRIPTLISIPTQIPWATATQEPTPRLTAKQVQDMVRRGLSMKGMDLSGLDLSGIKRSHARATHDGLLRMEASSHRTKPKFVP